MLLRTLVVLSLLFSSTSLLAKMIGGKIQSISQQAKVIQLINPKTKTVTVIKFSKDTKLVDAKTFKDLTVNTKIKADVDKSMMASKIKRILVKLPKERIITTDELSDLVDDGKKLFIGDARPKKKYNIGHIPTSRPTPAGKLAKNLNWLPKDKTTALVFYCGGVTCPLSPKAMKIAIKAGYKNSRAYVAGYPAWKKDVLPAHVNAGWLKKRLNKHQIILDVRKAPKKYIKGAVHFPASKLVKMHEEWNKKKFAVKKRTILNLRDKKAPIAIIADREDSDEAIEAYEMLTFWKFKRVAILKGGMMSWSKKGLPLGKGSIATKLNYIKKLSKGAISEEDFVKAVKSGKAIIIDVRSSDESSEGKIKGAMSIPLEDLDKHLGHIPKKGLVLIHCVGGSRASLAYTALLKKGYKNIKFLDDEFLEITKENGIKLQ
ncbi:MAG: hypothetical protein KAG61_08825 [Bacteriovoracaceae bacterium]|nr:hypothetical protein [Bacteriovoracaceae bacterium]